jgi:hypothetical protein
VRRPPWPMIAGLLVLALMGAACTSKKKESVSDVAAAAAKLEQASAKNPGAVLRATLDSALGEHVALLADAAAAEIQGRAPDAKQAADRLRGQNSTDLATAFGTIYPDSQGAFLSLWRRHIDFFLSYAAAAASGDSAGEHAAVGQLDAYALTFARFLNGLNPNLPVDAVESLFKDHATTVTAVIDAQAKKDYAKGYAALVAAYSHMDMIGGALAAAIVKQHPEKVQGVADSKPAALRAQLDAALQEQSVLLSSLGAAVVQKRAPDESAALAILRGTNAGDFAALIGTQYGSDAQATVLDSWTKQIGLYERYAKAVGAHDVTAEGKWRDALASAADDFGKVLNGVSPELDADEISDTVKLHVLSIKEVIDSLGRNDFGNAYDALLRAVKHMDDLAAAIADGISKQFPTKFV